MPARAPRTKRDWHRRFAVECFNAAWVLLEKRRRTPDEDDRMIHVAHASRHHWGVVGDANNRTIGEWQLSRVYAVLRRAEPATHHARRALAVCEAHGLGPFALAYAYEALARADSVAGRRRGFRLHRALAVAVGARIREREERALLSKDLRTLRAP
jgi:hypothetical protein